MKIDSNQQLTRRVWKILKIMVEATLMKWQFIRDETLKLVMKHLLKGEYVLYRGRHGRLIEVVEMSG